LTIIFSKTFSHLVNAYFCIWSVVLDNRRKSVRALNRVSVILHRGKACYIYRLSQKKRSIFCKVIVSVILSKKLYTYMCPIANGFRDRAISLCSYQIVDKKETLRSVFNTGVYYSIDKVGTVYLV
jgi:hypothetical protein